MVSRVTDLIVNKPADFGAVRGVVANKRGLAKSFEQELLSLISESLARMGLTPGDVQVSLEEAQRQSVSDSDTSRRILVTYVKPSEVPASTSGLGFQPRFMDPEQAASAGRYADPVTGELRTFGVNPNAFVDEATAEKVAALLGGEVEKRWVGETGGPYVGPVQHLIRVGDYLGDAALIARTYQNNPKWLADLCIRTEIAQSNGESVPSWEEAAEILNNGGSVLGVRNT